MEKLKLSTHFFRIMGGIPSGPGADHSGISLMLNFISLYFHTLHNHWRSSVGILTIIKLANGNTKHCLVALWQDTTHLLGTTDKLAIDPQIFSYQDYFCFTI